MRSMNTVLIVVSLAAVACGRDRPARADGAAPPPAMRMPGMARMAAERAYLDSVARGEPDDLAALALTHRVRMEQMLHAMDEDMQMMSMTADTAWRALADSVRSDLQVISEQQGQSLVLRLRAHAGRMRRLLGMHERMMGPMEM